MGEGSHLNFGRTLRLGVEAMELQGVLGTLELSSQSRSAPPPPPAVLLVTVLLPAFTTVPADTQSGEIRPYRHTLNQALQQEKQE